MVAETEALEARLREIEAARLEAARQAQKPPLPGSKPALPTKSTVGCCLERVRLECRCLLKLYPVLLTASLGQAGYHLQQAGCGAYQASHQRSQTDAYGGKTYTISQ